MFLNFSQAHLRRRVVSRQPRTITLLPLQVSGKIWLKSLPNQGVTSLTTTKFAMMRIVEPRLRDNREHQTPKT